MNKSFREDSIGIFLSLLKAGLWEKDIQLSPSENVDFLEVYRLAQEQSVVGLVAAGLEHITDIKPTKEQILTIVGEALQIEQRNTEMNHYLQSIAKKLNSEGINSILVKGQGIAQCYKRPLWRASGDIDLLLDKANYKRAKFFFDRITETPCPSTPKNIKRQHLEYQLGPWLVELHGNLHTHLSRRLDNLVDTVQSGVFENKEVRIWRNGDTAVMLPSPDNDVIFVFSHILQHFFLEGIGLRQICDLCRMLWTYREKINKELLFSRLKKMGVVSEWKAFGCLMVDYLGLPENAMPFYDTSYRSKAQRMFTYIIECGNFGHNKDFSHLKIKNSFVRKVHISCRQLKDSARLATMFPMDAPRFYLRFLYDGVVAAVNL